MAVTYTISGAGGLTHLSGNPIEIVLTASEAKANHRLALRVTCKTMAGVERIGSPFTEEIAPKALVATFDISGLVDYPAEYGFTFPIVGGCNPRDLLATKVTFEVGEIWIDNSGDRQESFTAGLETLKVLKGRLRAHELALLNEANKTFSLEYIEGGKFLTHQMGTQRIAHDQIATLWYLGRWSNDHEIVQNLKVTTNLREFTMTREATIYSYTGLVQFAFSALFWDGQSLEWGETVTSMEFWLNDHAGEVSEHRYYTVDNNYHEQSLCIYAVNPLSGIDLYWFTGAVREGLATESETAARQVPYGSGTQVASIKTISTKGQRTWEVNTGWHTQKDEMIALRDLLETRQAWIVDTQANKLIPVTVEPGDFDLYDPTEDLQAITIKLKEAHL